MTGWEMASNTLVLMVGQFPQQELAMLLSLLLYLLRRRIRWRCSLRARSQM
jgi:hypothetical protein